MIRAWSEQSRKCNVLALAPRNLRISNKTSLWGSGNLSQSRELVLTGNIKLCLERTGTMVQQVNYLPFSLMT